MKHNLFLGVTFTLAACFLYSLMAALLKAKAAIFPSLPVIVFLQNFFSFLLILPFIFKNGYFEAKNFLSTKKAKLHFLRSIFSVLISYLLYYSLNFIPLVNALLLANTAPLIVPFVGYIFFAEKINHRLWLPVILGYIGVIFVLHPDSHLFNSGAFFAFGSAIALAFTIQCVRRLTVTESTTTITFYFLFFSALISGIISIPFWEPVSLLIFLLLFVIGFLYFTSQYLANASMQFGNPQLISSLMYSNVIYAVIIEFLFWNTFPTFTTLLGMVLIIIGGISCIRVEQLASRKADKNKVELQFSA